MSLDATHVRATASACVGLLRDQLDNNWMAPIPDLDMTVAGVVAHMARVCLFYAVDLTARGDDPECIELGIDATADPKLLVDALQTCSTMLATAVDAAGPDARGFHPWGAADRSGFAAMACDEMLIHTDDAARGFGIEFTPPLELAELTLRRLFPWVSDVSDPWAQLRWANGRIPFEDQPQLDQWKWHCAPLDEWRTD